ncbi:hypothetical protein K440DRAFT_641284 [Wilcoxina mikolae CBS 423.85]|nr:hypothetical protein K440DRAFT_641284 [Wilcoxina mikolae CBS 423.85]
MGLFMNIGTDFRLWRRMGYYGWVPVQAQRMHSLFMKVGYDDPKGVQPVSMIRSWDVSRGLNWNRTERINYLPIRLDREVRSPPQLPQRLIRTLNPASQSIRKTLGLADSDLNTLSSQLKLRTSLTTDLSRDEKPKCSGFLALGWFGAAVAATADGTQ